MSFLEKIIHGVTDDELAEELGELYKFNGYVCAKTGHKCETAELTPCKHATMEYVCSHTGEKCTTATEHFTNFYHFVNGLADEGSSRIISTQELNLCRLCVDGTAIRPCKVWMAAFNQLKASKQR